MTSAYEWIITTRSFYRTRIELLSAAFPRLHSLPNKISELFSRTKFDDWKKKDQLWGYNNIPAKAEILIITLHTRCSRHKRIYAGLWKKKSATSSEIIDKQNTTPLVRSVELRNVNWNASQWEVWCGGIGHWKASLGEIKHTSTQCRILFLHERLRSLRWRRCNKGTKLLPGPTWSLFSRRILVENVPDYYSG